MTKSEIKKFAVFGNPIEHSKSPQIHQIFATQVGLNIDYQRILATEDNFFALLDKFFAQENAVGANITVPFKELVLDYATNLNPAAKFAKAANTLYKPQQSQGVMIADNTDGVGLVTDITVNKQFVITGKKILLLGAGGAARGVIMPLLNEHPQSLTITNRTISKAELLCEEFYRFGYINCLPNSEVVDNYDLIINATSASLAGQMLAIRGCVFTERSLAYDMMYSKTLTPFLKQAQDNKAKVVDGSGMLVEQAAKSFEIWNGVMPDTKDVLKVLLD